LFAVNPIMEMPAHYHFLLGGFAFGAVFMATDPVTSARTEKRKVDTWLFNRTACNNHSGFQSGIP